MLIGLASGQSPEWPPAQFSFPDGDSELSFDLSSVTVSSPHVRLIYDAAVYCISFCSVSVLCFLDLIVSFY